MIGWLNVPKNRPRTVSDAVAGASAATLSAFCTPAFNGSSAMHRFASNAVGDVFAWLPGCVVASIVTAAVTGSSGEAMLTRCGQEAPGIANVTSPPPLRFAVWIAWRSEPGPLSPVLVTTVEGTLGTWYS